MSKKHRQIRTSQYRRNSLKPEEIFQNQNSPSNESPLLTTREAPINTINSERTFSNKAILSPYSNRAVGSLLNKN